MKSTRFVGLDVHAASIAVAVAEPNGEVRALGTIPHEPEALRKLLRRLGAPQSLRVCYEAGPCGYALYWQLTQLGVACTVVAPTLVPVRAGDRVKTDRRDAAKLARSFRSGDLTPVWVPDAAHEALRDLVRAREAAKRDQLRARHRLQKFLLRHGCRPPAGVTPWTQRFRQWVGALTFANPAQEATRLDYVTEVAHAADRIERLERALDAAVAAVPVTMRRLIEGLQALRGIARVAAATIVAEVGPLSRFERPRQLMGYSGAVPSEHSSGPRTRRGHITKTGNAHLRRVLIEAAWALGPLSINGNATSANPSRRSPGRPSTVCTAATVDSPDAASPNSTSSPPWAVNSSASSGPLASRSSASRPPRSRSDPPRLTSCP